MWHRQVRGICNVTKAMAGSEFSPHLKLHGESTKKRISTNELFIPIDGRRLCLLMKRMVREALFGISCKTMGR